MAARLKDLDRRRLQNYFVEISQVIEPGEWQGFSDHDIVEWLINRDFMRQLDDDCVCTIRGDGIIWDETRFKAASIRNPGDCFSPALTRTITRTLTLWSVLLLQPLADPMMFIMNRPFLNVLYPPYNPMSATRSWME